MDKFVIFNINIWKCYVLGLGVDCMEDCKEFDKYQLEVYWYIFDNF